MNNAYLQTLISEFSPQQLVPFLREKNRNFRPTPEKLYELDADQFSMGEKIGEIPFTLYESLGVYAIKVTKNLSERTGKKYQYELAKKVLKDSSEDAGIFVFYDAEGSFRFSLVYANYQGTKRDWSTFRRFTYFVSAQLTNKTFLQRVGEGDFSSLDKIKEAFSVEKVTKDFYQEISYWYFWACQQVRFPEAAEKEENGRKVAVIRMITRLIFIWFMREKGLVTTKLFDLGTIKQWLKEVEDQSSSYYLAILQNLFFATLNTKKEERQFRSTIKGYKGYNPDFDNPYKYRHYSRFAQPECLEEYFQEIPFLNGGLFDCLDNKRKQLYFDGFSDRENIQPSVPNRLFFSPETSADFNTELGSKDKPYKVKGLFEILSAYNFTIDENTVDDKDVALDPELLGRVFENLLASFNPETSSTARKATGSYYTPREIVDYMVDESLKAYLRDSLQDIPELDSKIAWLFSQTIEGNPFNMAQVKRIVKLIEGVRIVDPAVGSGAFPMGALNKLVHILAKLDPDSKLWQNAQLEAAESIPDAKIRASVQASIRNYFTEKNPDYGRKLFLIQKCIYGVDIQQIAVEIAKLRFFISLLVEETVDKQKPNWGVEPLPNLDFKIMQGNSLIMKFKDIDFSPNSIAAPEETLFAGLDEKSQMIKEFQNKKEVYQSESDHQHKKELQQEIDDLLRKIFKRSALEQHKDYAQGLAAIERKYAPIPDKETRERITAIKKQEYSKIMGIDVGAMERELAQYSTKHWKRDFFPWGLYFAEVFIEKNGFDIVLGNPPYIQLQKDGGGLANLYTGKGYDTFNRMGDIYCLFYELGYKLLRQGGHLVFITSNKWMRAGYGVQLRKFFAEKTNPKLLIDFAGKQLFDNVTVDNNILLYQKGENQQICQTLAAGEEFKAGSEMARYITDNLTVSHNFIDSDTWVISTPIEERIRQKIEALGTPLGEWGINIYYGIKTGYNEAFIIDGRTKDRLIAEDPKSAEILKPILRGRDIKRYRAEFADLWLIDSNNGYTDSIGKRIPPVDISRYPAVKRWLDGHWEKISVRGDKGKTPYNLRDCAYYQEFEEEKIIYPNMTKYLPFILDNEKYFTNQKCFIMTGENLGYLTALFNSQLFKFVYREKFPVLLGGTRELSKIFFDKLRIPRIAAEKEIIFHDLVISMQQSIIVGLPTIETDKTINTLLYEMCDLNQKEREIIDSYEL